MADSSLADALFGKKPEELFVWQDQEVRFDASPADLDLRPGEQLLEFLDAVEDVKGNSDDPGTLQVTNLRVVWMSSRSRRVNISIGHNCITSIGAQDSASRLRGSSQSVSLLTKHNGQRFEFVFCHLAEGGNSRLASTLHAVHHSYESTRLYRDLRLRGAIIQDKELRLLPQEQVYSKVNGVHNLSSEQGSLGMLFISNLRVVWFAMAAENFNVSIPYLQMKSVKVRDSKFGPALVVETSPRSGGYVLGFKVDPRETLDYVAKEIVSLWQTYAVNPTLGVTYKAAEGEPVANKPKAVEDDVHIVDTSVRSDLWATYYANGDSSAERPPVYCAELGLAVESLRDGATVEQLWSIL